MGQVRANCSHACIEPAAQPPKGRQPQQDGQGTRERTRHAPRDSTKTIRYPVKCPK